MLDATAFLAALQLADSFFPTGMYAHSHGLEPMAARGLVATAEDVEEFLVKQLTWSVAPSDGVALLNAHAAAGNGDLELLKRIDHLLCSMKLPSELRAASGQLGRRLLAETGPFESSPIHAEYAAAVSRQECPGNGAVALGLIAYASNISAEQAFLVFCHGHAVSVLGAAMRLLQMSHIDAQAVLRRLHPRLAETVHEIRGRPWEEMTSFSPALDVMSMAHENDDLRLFAS